LQQKNHLITSSAVANMVGIMKAHFEQFAAYNRWANARLYQAAFALSETDYRRDVGGTERSMMRAISARSIAVPARNSCA
jgi:hypothetical protein